MATSGATRPRYLVLQRVHPLNLALALVWSAFVPVFYWRREHLSESWVRRFGRLHPDDHLTLDQWQRETERAFHAYKAARRDAAYRMEPLQLHGARVDYSGSWEQWLAVALEDRHLFAALVKAWMDAREVTVYSGRSPIEALRFSGSDLPQGVRRAAGFEALDRVWFTVRAFGTSLKQMARLFRNEGRAPLGLRRVLWTGIGAREAADSDRQLSFSFLVDRGLLKADESLYMLAALPTRAATARLEQLGISWSTVSAFGFLPFAHKARALCALAATALRAVFSRGNPQRALLAQFAAESIPWMAAARALGSRAYVTSVSDSWPERPEVGALNAMGLRTINWSYGANTFLYAKSDAEFRDLGVARSLSVAQEIWIWTPEVERWLRARALDRPPTIRTIGAVMSGDSRWLRHTPTSARAAFGLDETPGRKLIAVFDVPTVRRESRHVPSMYPPQMLEQFFRDIDHLLKRFPQVGVIVKPKRSLQDTHRQFAESMQQMIVESSAWRTSGRVITLRHDIDPYIPVALADICIGIPFTSPVIAALQTGRHGVFHDPLSAVQRVPQAPELLAYLTHGTAELEERVSACLDGDVNPSGLDDPGEAFAGLLRRVSGIPPARA